MGLASHINVWNACLLILRKRGFVLRISGELNADGTPEARFWIAEKEGFYFCADNPIELLGLASIHDYIRPEKDEDYWWRIEGEDVVAELYETAFPDKGDQ